MKNIMIILTLFFGELFSKEVSWKLSTVYVTPESGLHFVGAHREKNGTIKSSFLDHKIKKSANNKPVLVLCYDVSASASHGVLCIKMRKDYDNAEYVLHFDCSRGSLNRDRRNKKHVEMDIASEDQDKYLARAWLKKNGTIIASTYKKCADDDQLVIFDVLLEVNNTTFSLCIDPPLDHLCLLYESVD